MQPSEISRNHQNGRLIRKGDRIRKRRSVQPLFGNFIDKKRLSGKKAVIDHRVFIVNADESVPILPVPFIQLFPIVGRKIVFGDKMLKVLCRWIQLPGDKAIAVRAFENNKLCAEIQKNAYRDGGRKGEKNVSGDTPFQLRKEYFFSQCNTPFPKRFWYTVGFGDLFPASFSDSECAP